MSDSRAVVTTDRPARYGKQLVNHLGRKQGGEWDDTASTGWVALVDGRLEASVGEGGLVLSLTAPEPDLERLEHVVGRHLVRFGARDDLVCAWTRADGQAGSCQVVEAEPAD